MYRIGYYRAHSEGCSKVVFYTCLSIHRGGWYPDLWSLVLSLGYPVVLSLVLLGGTPGQGIPSQDRVPLKTVVSLARTGAPLLDRRVSACYTVGSTPFVVTQDCLAMSLFPVRKRWPNDPTCYFSFMLKRIHFFLI